MASQPGIRVIKFGGSLLLADNIQLKLRDWLSSNADLNNLMVVGGGQLVGFIREL